jgi:hypothetical protein
VLGTKTLEEVEARRASRALAVVLSRERAAGGVAQEEES